jgi:ribose transport system substrate-binding protein
MLNRPRSACFRRRHPLAGGVLVAWLCLFACGGCRKQTSYRIAVIPRTTGRIPWESLHTGVAAAAYSFGIDIYWNATTRQDDVSGQVALIDRLVAQGSYQGIVIAPNQSLALITPVRRAVAKGIPIVIVGSPLLTSPGGKLFYVLNDDQEGGRIAARRIATLLHGKGSVAILGINPDIAGTLLRARAFEELLARMYPDIHVVDKRIGSFNEPHEQQVAEETLKANPHLDAVIALSASTTLGVLSTIGSNPEYGAVKVIGFDPDPVDLSSANLDSLVLEDMPQMGIRAIDFLHDEREGKSVPSQIEVEPMLVTRENVNSTQVRQWASTDFRPGPHRDWGSR